MFGYRHSKGLGRFCHLNDPQQRRKSHKSDDASDVVFTKISGAVLFAASIPFLVIGIPVLTANIYYYNVHKNHAIKRDKYRESLKLYKQRRERENSDAVQLMIIPSVNFANASGGVNLLVAF